MEAEVVEDFLEHYGVKGMKWGKHSQKRLDRLNRVASGKGNLADRAGVALTEVSRSNVVRNKGLQGAAADKAGRMEARKSRIQKGEATVKDVLNQFGGDRIVDWPATKRASPVKWTEANQRRLDQLNRVGEGKGSTGDKIKVGLMEVSTDNRRVNGGLAGAAADKAQRMEARKLRIQKGEATVADILNKFGGDRIVDFPSKKKS